MEGFRKSRGYYTDRRAAVLVMFLIYSSTVTVQPEIGAHLHMLKLLTTCKHACLCKLGQNIWSIIINVNRLWSCGNAIIEIPGMHDHDLTLLQNENINYSHTIIPMLHAVHCIIIQLQVITN